MPTQGTLRKRLAAHWRKLEASLAVDSLSDNALMELARASLEIDTEIWLVGMKNILGGIKGRNRRPSANYDELRYLYETERPGRKTNTATYRAVSKMRGVSARTVRRAVTGH
jgi:hypothetical protein